MPQTLGVPWHLARLRGGARHRVARSPDSLISAPGARGTPRPHLSSPSQLFVLVRSASPQGGGLSLGRKGACRAPVPRLPLPAVGPAGLGGGGILPQLWPPPAVGLWGGHGPGQAGPAPPLPVLAVRHIALLLLSRDFQGPQPARPGAQVGWKRSGKWKAQSRRWGQNRPRDDRAALAGAQACGHPTSPPQLARDGRSEGPPPQAPAMRLCSSLWGLSLVQRACLVSPREILSNTLFLLTWGRRPHVVNVSGLS